MKKVFVFLVAALMVFALVGCGEKEEPAPDYADAASFEAALNSGADLTGKTVQFGVDTLVPNSAFGYNMQAGAHLNFCSEKNPKVSAGDIVTVEVTEVISAAGSYIIYYKMK